MPIEVLVLVLSLEAALYPTLLAAVIVLLAQPRPMRMLGAYLAGGLVTSIGLGCLIVFALGGAVDSSSATLSWTIDLAVGGFLLLVAVALARRTDVRLRDRRAARKAGARPPADDDKEPWTQRILARGSVPLVLFAGLVVNVPGAAYLVGLKDIAAAHVSTVLSLLLILQFNAIMFLLAEIPLAGLLVAPDRTDALVQKSDTWLTGHSRQIAIVVCLLISAFLIAKGIANAT